MSDDDDAFPIARPDSRLATALAASPNHNCRKGVAGPDLILLHYTGMPSAAAAIARLTDPNPPQVSAHYIVCEDGEVIQSVAEERRAWHAGLGDWEGRTDINSRSIGIEIVNPGHEFGYRAFPDLQVEAVVALCADIIARTAIPAHRILAHSDVAPLRKQDPGELFPWDRLARAGLGLWVPPHGIMEGPRYRAGEEGPPIQALQAMFAMLGYGVAVTGVFDALTVAVVTAFQRHWRQERVDGIADLSTLRTLKALVDRASEK